MGGRTGLRIVLEMVVWLGCRGCGRRGGLGRSAASPSTAAATGSAPPPAQSALAGVFGIRAAGVAFPGPDGCRVRARGRVAGGLGEQRGLDLLGAGTFPPLRLVLPARQGVGALPGGLHRQAEELERVLEVGLAGESTPP